MASSDTGRIGAPPGVTLEIPSLLEQLAQADHLEEGGRGREVVRDQIAGTLVSAVDQYGLLHPVPMQVLIHIVNRWVGVQGSPGEPILEDVLSRIKRMCREGSRKSHFNDNVFNVLLRLSEACARAGRENDGLQFMALNELLVESWRGENHPDYAGAIYNQGRYFRLLGRHSDAQSEFERALLVTGSEDFEGIRSHIQQSLDRLKEGQVHHEYSDPPELRPLFCLLESSLLSQRQHASREILLVARTHHHLELRRDHEGIGKGRADADPDVWQPLSLARLHLGGSPAHVQAALVFERERASSTPLVREESMALLSRMPAGRPSADIFDSLALHMSKALQSEDSFIREHAARCLYECSGWGNFPRSVVEAISSERSGRPTEVTKWMVDILYSAAQYSDTDLTPAVPFLRKAHLEYPEYRPKPGRTLCRHLERNSEEPYIELLESPAGVLAHWKIERSRIPLYGVSGEEMKNESKEVGHCSLCHSESVSCLFFSKKKGTVCEIYCDPCDRYTNYRFFPEPSY